jgi:hypothetical protein
MATPQYDDTDILISSGEVRVWVRLSEFIANLEDRNSMSVETDNDGQLIIYTGLYPLNGGQEK